MQILQQTWSTGFANAFSQSGYSTNPAFAGTILIAFLFILFNLFLLYKVYNILDRAEWREVGKEISTRIWRMNVMTTLQETMDKVTKAAADNAAADKAILQAVNDAASAIRDLSLKVGANFQPQLEQIATDLEAAASNKTTVASALEQTVTDSGEPTGTTPATE